MKKIYLFLSLVMISSALFSQESKISVGLHIAPSITSIRGNSMIDKYDSRFVISPGLTFDYHITQNLSFNSGLAFERKGAKTEMFLTDITGVSIGNQEVKINYDYLTLPLMATYNTNGKVSFYIGGGTFLGFLISQKFVSSAVDDTPGKTEDNTDNTKRIDIGLSLTTGVNIPMADKLTLDLGLRDYLGLINTSKVISINDGSIKTNSFSIVLGLKYKI